MEVIKMKFVYCMAVVLVVLGIAHATVAAPTPDGAKDLNALINEYRGATEIAVSVRDDGTAGIFITVEIYAFDEYCKPLNVSEGMYIIEVIDFGGNPDVCACRTSSTPKGLVTVSIDGLGTISAPKAKQTSISTEYHDMILPQISNDTIEFKITSVPVAIIKFRAPVFSTPDGGYYYRSYDDRFVVTVTAIINTTTNDLRTYYKIFQY